MKCELCQIRDATVHLTQVIEGQVRKLHLCEQCAKESGVDIQNPVAVANLFFGLAPAAPEQAEVSRSPCPRCHLSLADFKKTGRLGCAQCYSHFASELAGLLKAMHHRERHVGKRPAQLAEAEGRAERLAELKRQLEEAVAAENFEFAAKLRDQIRALGG